MQKPDHCSMTRSEIAKTIDCLLVCFFQHCDYFFIITPGCTTILMLKGEIARLLLVTAYS